MENENLFSKNDAITSSGVASKSNLQNLIKRTNEELDRLNQAIQSVKTSEFIDKKKAKFIEKVLSKYRSSIVNVDAFSLTTEKSIWFNAKEYFIDSDYENVIKSSCNKLTDKASSEFSGFVGQDIYLDMKNFSNASIELLNATMQSDFSFYIKNINIKSSSPEELPSQFELVIDIK